MALQIVASGQGSVDLDAVAASLQEETTLRGSVEEVSELANDGKVIDDQRDYE